MLPRADDEANAGSDPSLRQAHISLAKLFFRVPRLTFPALGSARKDRSQEAGNTRTQELGLRHLTCLAISHTAACQPELCDEQLET